MVWWLSISAISIVDYRAVSPSIDGSLQVCRIGVGVTEVRKLDEAVAILVLLVIHLGHGVEIAVRALLLVQGNPDRGC